MICLNQGILSWEWHDWVPSAGVTVKVCNIFLTAFAIEMNIIYAKLLNVHTPPHTQNALGGGGLIKRLK